MGNILKNEPPASWAFESKEFLRQKLIGKIITVKIDGVRQFKTESKTNELIMGTIYIDNKCVGSDILERGLA